MLPGFNPFDAPRPLSPEASLIAQSGGTLGPAPAPGWGSPLIAQTGQSGLLGGAAPPPPAAGLTPDDVQKALGMLYSQLDGGADWVKDPSAQQGLLGHAMAGLAPGAATGQPGGQPGGQQPSTGAQTLFDAFQGFQQYQDVGKQLKTFQAANNGGRTASGSEEGGGDW